MNVKEIVIMNVKEIVILLMGFFMLGVLAGCLLLKSYKEGQVDALTGNIKYKLVVNKDRTSTWEYIKK